MKHRQHPYLLWQLRDIHQEAHERGFECPGYSGGLARVYFFIIGLVGRFIGFDPFQIQKLIADGIEVAKDIALRQWQSQLTIGAWAPSLLW